MITYDQQNKFYNQALEIVEKMGGRISAHGNLHGIFLSVIVFMTVLMRKQGVL